MFGDKTQIAMIVMIRLSRVKYLANHTLCSICTRPINIIMYMLRIGRICQNLKREDYLDKLILGNLVNLRLLKERNSQGKFSIEGTLGVDVFACATDIDGASRTWPAGSSGRVIPSFPRICRCSIAAVARGGGGGCGCLGSGKPPMGRTKLPVAFLIVSLSGATVVFLACGLVFLVTK